MLFRSRRVLRRQRSWGVNQKESRRYHRETRRQGDRKKEEQGWIYTFPLRSPRLPVSLFNSPGSVRRDGPGLEGALKKKSQRPGRRSVKPLAPANAGTVMLPPPQRNMGVAGSLAALAILAGGMNVAKVVLR